jgi:hypothetical protein
MARASDESVQAMSKVLLSCSQPVLLAEIPERFSSSSLPPSFARGRCTTDFLPARQRPGRPARRPA